MDGSAATEASIEYGGGAVSLPSGASVVNVAAAQTLNGGVTSTALIQDAQKTSADWVTNVACTSCGPYPNTPHVQYGVAGVSGTPSSIGYYTPPTSPYPWAVGSGESTNLTFATGSSAGSVLWSVSPHYVGPETCDSCNSLVEDFYIWPQLNSSGSTPVREWEEDLIYYNQTVPKTEPGADLQCSVDDGGWDWNYQGTASWSKFYLNPPTNTQKITQDCAVSGHVGLPFGTLNSSGISASTTSFPLLGYQPPRSVVENLIVLVNSEEILCQLTASSSGGSICANAVRGWAGTVPTSHTGGVTWTGSVHVQYHVSLFPGNNACQIGSTSVDCAFIDYLILNGVRYDFHQIYGQYLSTGIYGVAVPVPALPSGYTSSGILNQMQMDVPTASTSVGEFLDLDNMSASWGVLASRTCKAP